jgi:uncharacterized protein (DUF58 family)
MIAGRRATEPGATSRAPVLLEESFRKRLERFELVVRSTQPGRTRGQRSARKVGVGIEFAEHRPYTPGDDLRFLDFHAYARSDRLLLKQFSETQSLTVYVLLDCSASMGFGHGQKLHFAKQLAAALGYVALGQLDRLCIQCFANGLGARLAPTRGRYQALSMLRFLERQRAAGSTDLTLCAKRFVARENERGLVVVVTDGYDLAGFAPGIDVLRYARFEPVVLLVTDPKERTPVPAGDLLLQDCETGQSRELEVTASALERYRRGLLAHFGNLRAHLRDKQVPVFELHVEQPFDSALIDVLRRGGLWL